VLKCALNKQKRCSMKKIIAAVLITVMIISLTGCSAVSFMAGMNAANSDNNGGGGASGVLNSLFGGSENSASYTEKLTDIDSRIAACVDPDKGDGSRTVMAANGYLPMSHGRVSVDIRENCYAYILIEYEDDADITTEASEDACVIRDIFSRMISLKGGTIISTVYDTELLCMTWQSGGSYTWSAPATASGALWKAIRLKTRKRRSLSPIFYMTNLQRSTVFPIRCRLRAAA